MKLKEKDKIPNSEIFVLENGEPVQKNIEEFERRQPHPPVEDVITSCPSRVRREATL